jgi:hypothetical protein
MSQNAKRLFPVSGARRHRQLFPTKPALSGTWGGRTVTWSWRGFAFRKSAEIVNAVFAVITEALRHGEDVEIETTLGTFEVVYGPRQQTRVRFGKRQTLFRNPGVQARLGGAGAAETGA